MNVTFEKPIEQAYGFAVSPDSQTLAVPATTKEVMLLELLTGKLIRTIALRDIDRALSLAFSTDGAVLAIGSAGDVERDTGKVSIELWDMDKMQHRVSLRSHKHSVLCVAISPDKRTIISGGTEDGARVWDVATAKQKFHLDPKLRVNAVAFMPDGNSFVTFGDRSPAHFWDTKTGKAVSPLKGKLSE